MLKVFYKLLSTKMSASMRTVPEIKTFVFLDLETTGLPLYENNTTKITELCLTTVQADHIRLGVFPRVQNKLNLCFNPCKLISDGSEKITVMCPKQTTTIMYADDKNLLICSKDSERLRHKGQTAINYLEHWTRQNGLSNNLLEHSQIFSQQTVNSIQHFLNHILQPVCFVAHNGFNFDYPVLRRELEKATKADEDVRLQEDILCIDTLVAFRELEQQQDVEENVSETKESQEIVQENADSVDGVRRNVPLEFTPQFDELLFSCDAQIKNETTPQKQIIKTVVAPPNPKKLKLVEARKSLNFGISYKLGDVFSRLTKKEPLNAHQAEADVQMLIMCAATFGDKFVDWCNENAKKFCDIPAMTPGRKIGT